MSVKHCIGTSGLTALKHEQLREILHVHIPIFSAITNKHSFARREYCYLETTAGEGIYHDGTLGSPLIFLEEARAAGVPYVCDFIEQSIRNCKNLRSHVDARCKVHHGLYEDIINATDSRSPGSFGLLFCDPNGDFNEEALAKFSKSFPRIDILINVNGSGIKRGVARHGGNRIKKKLEIIGKRHWIIRKPYGQWQWSFVIGTGWDGLLKKFQHLDMHDIDSMIGRSYLDRLERTNEERLSDVQGVLAAPGVLECKGSRVETCGWQV